MLGGVVDGSAGSRPANLFAAVMITVGGAAIGVIVGGWFGVLVGFYCGASAGVAISNGGEIRRFVRYDRSLRREALAEAGRGYGAAVGAVGGVGLAASGWWVVSVGAGALIGHAVGGALVGVVLAGYFGRAVFSVVFSFLPDAGVALGLWVGTALADATMLWLGLLAGVVTGGVGWLLGTFLSGFVSTGAGFREPAVIAYH